MPTTPLSVNVKTNGGDLLLQDTTGTTPRAACEAAARDNGWPASAARTWTPAEDDATGAGTLFLEWGEKFATYTYPPDADWHSARGHRIEAGSTADYCHACHLHVPRTGAALAPYTPHTVFDA